ncbi:MAG: hypothetical protein QGG09_05930, partial [Pirellulaceae bacterium]|nr:hypothetical protein [Pirellulaceae bacterium]
MNDKNDWEELIDRHLRGELEESEKERLAELLDSNAAARQEFVEQVQVDTEFAEALRESSQSSRAADILTAERTKTNGQWASKPTFLRLMLAAAAVVIVALSAGLIYQLAYPESGIAESNEIATQPRVSDVSIARITGLSGSLIWTGDR